MIEDIRYAVRSLGRAKAFTAGAVLTLALGIGGNSTMFTLANAALFRPMAGVDAPSEVVWISTTRAGGRMAGLSYPDYVDYRSATTGVFADIGAYAPQPISLGGTGAPERIHGAAVTGSLLPMLGVGAVLGRTLGPSDDVRGGPAVAVITTRLWKNRFGGSPDVLRKPVVINGRDFAIVGVLAGNFRGPALGETADVWIPMAIVPEVRSSEPDLLQARGASWLMALGRLRRGVGPMQAQAAMTAVALQLQAQYPEADRDRTVRVSGAGSPITPSGRNELIPLAAVLVGVAGLVLAIACANIANLLLARGASRSLELSIRASLGASRRRLVRQLLTESAVIASAGAAVGLLATFWAADMLVGMAGPEFDAMQASPDWRVLLFTIAVAALSVCAFALLPAFVSTRQQLVPGLRATVSAGGRSRLQGAFVIAQLALSVVLLLAAGLGLRALRDSTSIDLGFTPDNVTTASYDLVLQNYPEGHREAFRRDLLARVRALRGVESASIANLAPLGGIVVAGVATVRDARVFAGINAVAPEYFATMRIPIVEGRSFTDEDRPGAPTSVIVNQTFARRFWPDHNALGQQIRVGLRTRVEAQIIGIARDSKYDEQMEAPQPFVYFALAQQPAFDSETLIVRTSASAGAIGGALERTIRHMDPALPVYDVHLYADILHERVDKERALGVLFSAFGGLALLLAAIGLYGVMSHGTAQRTRELGVRLALGATPRQLAELIARDGLRLGLIGTAIGTVLALPLVRLVGAFVFGVHAGDVAVFATVCALLNAVVLAAALLPALRAARLQPLAALRTE
jgi:predicted permease